MKVQVFTLQKMKCKKHEIHNSNFTEFKPHEFRLMVYQVKYLNAINSEFSVFSDLVSQFKI